MTDFATELPGEKEPPEPLAVAKDDRCLRPGRVRETALAAAQAQAAVRPAEPVAEVPVRATAPLRPLETQAEPPPVREAEADRAAQAEADRQAATRREALVGALVLLQREPRAAALLPLLEAYRGAARVEVEAAATALATLYLRAATETRRRLRPALSEAVRRAGDSPLAESLAGRLGAIALPRQAPPTPAPPEPEP